LMIYFILFYFILLGQIFQIPLPVDYENFHE
jgi:hypothetical protein